jgi:hypothetical protein
VLIQSDKRVKEYPNPADEEHVTFYLERQQFMDPSKRYAVPIEVNGYKFEAVFGEKNILPKSVVAVLKNAKSVISGKAGGMSQPHAVDTATGGQGRAQSQIMAGQPDYRYINDYNVIEE